MKYLASCICAALSLSAVSCVQGTYELPSDQAAKTRLHRAAPSEDIMETGRTKEGSPMPATSDGSWKF